MPTIISHFAAASALATFAPKGVSGTRLAIICGTLAMIPDLDVIGLMIGIPYGHALGHRGFTHSILFALLIAVSTPFVAFRSVTPWGRTWWALVALAFTATMSHGVLDAFTDAGRGVGFLIPFDNGRYFAPWRPLATSPMSVPAFIQGPALQILKNELIWIGLPLLGLLAFVYAVRAIPRTRRDR